MTIKLELVSWCPRSACGSEFHGDNKQAHEHGLSWSKNGVYSCCDSVRLNTSYTFELEPGNPYDKHAVQVFGKQTKGLVGHVPRECNIFIGGLLRKSRDGTFAVMGERVCGRMMAVECIVEGPLPQVEKLKAVTNCEM